eukprot:jgi/Mesvir1/1770/Mv09620-RA.2
MRHLAINIISTMADHTNCRSELFGQKRRRYRFRAFGDSGPAHVAIKGLSVGNYAGSAGLFVAKMITVAATRRICSAPAWLLLRSMILSKGLPKALQSKIRKMLGRVSPIAPITTGAHDVATGMALPYLALHIASLAMQVHAAAKQQRIHPGDRSKKKGYSTAVHSERIRDDLSELPLMGEKLEPCRVIYSRHQPSMGWPADCVEVADCAVQGYPGMAADIPSWVGGNLEWLPHEVLREPPWSHVVHWHGFDEGMRPVIFVRPAAMFEHFAPEEHARFVSVLLSSMEYAWRHLLLRLPDGTGSTVCALIDAQGLGLRKMPNLEVVKRGIALLNQHYAGCAGRLLVVNVPPVLSYVVAGLKHFMHPGGWEGTGRGATCEVWTLHVYGWEMGLVLAVARDEVRERQFNDTHDSIDLRMPLHDGWVYSSVTHLPFSS